MLHLMNQRPFQSLEVRLNNGDSILIELPFEISVTPNSPTVVVHTEGATRHVSYRNIAEVISRPTTAIA